MFPVETSLTLDGPPHVSAALFCGIVPNTTEYVTTWITPDNGNFTLPGIDMRIFEAKHRIVNGNFGGNTPQGSILIVLRLSYLDAGNYTCSIAFTGGPNAGTTHSADIELILSGKEKIITAQY